MANFGACFIQHFVFIPQVRIQCCPAYFPCVTFVNPRMNQSLAYGWHVSGFLKSVLEHHQEEVFKFHCLLTGIYFWVCKCLVYVSIDPHL